MGLPAFAWFGGLALAFWSLSPLAKQGGRRAMILAGMLGGLVAAWRIEMLVLMLAAFPLIWRRPRAKPYLFGITVGLTPTIAFMTVAGREVLENVFVSRMAVNAQLKLAEVPVAVWFGIGVCCLVTAGLTIAGIRQAAQRRLTLALAALCVLLLPQGLQRIDDVHLTYVMCVIAPVGLGHLLSRFSARSGLVRSTSTHPRAVTALTLSLLTALTVPSVGLMLHSNVTTLTHNGRTSRVLPTDKPAVAAALASITRNIPPGSRIFVGSDDMSVPTISDVALYHLLPEYRATAYYLELPSGVAERRGSPLMHDILQADALILTDVPEWYRQQTYPYIADGANDVNRDIASNFCVVERLRSTTIYLRCEAH